MPGMRAYGSEVHEERGEHAADDHGRGKAQYEFTNWTRQERHVRRVGLERHRRDGDARGDAAFGEPGSDPRPGERLAGRDECGGDRRDADDHLPPTGERGEGRRALHHSADEAEVVHRASLHFGRLGRLGSPRERKDGCHVAEASLTADSWQVLCNTKEQRARHGVVTPRRRRTRRRRRSPRRPAARLTTAAGRSPGSSPRTLRPRARRRSRRRPTCRNPHVCSSPPACARVRSRRAGFTRSSGIVGWSCGFDLRCCFSFVLDMLVGASPFAAH